MLSSTSRCALAGAACLATVIGSQEAHAQAPQGASIAAQALFKEGRALVDAGAWAEGCKKLEASLALFASASTMLNIARCREHEGRIASAWDDYHQALTLNRETRGAERRRGLEELARRGIAALEPRLPKLRVIVKGAPPKLEVLLDGKPILAAALGEALPADPGPHEIRAAAPGYRVETRSVTLAEAQPSTVELALVAEAPARPSPEAGAGKPAGVPGWAMITGGVGLGLVGAGVYFLADDLSAIHALRANCRPESGGTYCKPGYDYQRDDARKNRGFGLAVGLGGTGVLAVGAGLAGVVRGLTVKKAAPVAVVPWVAPGVAAVTLSGRF